MASTTDWNDWHTPYDDPTSNLSRRLSVVQDSITEWLDERPGEVRVVSACAGDGRDVLGVLTRRQDVARVSLVLVETDPRNAERARSLARDAGVARVDIRELDAGMTDAYVGAVPADLVLLCGIFGNISTDDVRGTIAATSMLCAAGARVIWTRHTKAPDLTPSIRAWFAAAGFREHAFTAAADAVFGVGVHDLVGDPQPLSGGRRLFRFVR